MKIEKVNDNQIRCTLTREDLASRELKISELAYGSEKAKSLFRDMMQQANYEFGFEAEDIPLMIEAIPLNSECLVLIITKVEDPEELDTRFARFAPSVTEDITDESELTEDSPDEIADLFRRLQEHNTPLPMQPSQQSKVEDKCMRAFLFDSLQQVMNAASLTGVHYKGASSLYKEEKSGKYLLILLQDTQQHDTLDRICFCLSEYGTVQRSIPSYKSFLDEHFAPLIADNALQVLGHTV